MRLIDADVLLANVKRNAPFVYSVIAPIVFITPTVDAVRVVHCKDCEYYIPWNGGRICARFCSYYRDTKHDDFCSRGVRKNEVD